MTDISAQSILDNTLKIFEERARTKGKDFFMFKSAAKKGNQISFLLKISNLLINTGKVSISRDD